LRLGHGYEVDVWSLGCVLFTLLLGKPPFETATLKDTYSKIRKNEYKIPDNHISEEGYSLIQRCLKHEPTERPTMRQIAMDPFFAGFTPATLPTSVCTVAPRYAVKPTNVQPVTQTAVDPDKLPLFLQQQQQRRPFTEQQQNDQALIASRHQQVASAPPPLPVNERSTDVNPLNTRLTSAVASQVDTASPSQLARPMTSLDDQPFVPAGPTNEEINNDSHLAHDLHRQLEHLILAKPNERLVRREDEAEDPASAPMLWISKWVDYSDKYGLGYQLCDDSVGVLFNDLTRLIMTAGGAENLQYIDREGYEHLCTMKEYPEQLKKKVTLLKVRMVM
jgi:polo-like kinase 1